ncbi:MAG TPA: outer membrane beta-barrel protein [Rhizomicrobium sp.]|nr:outer membrane beta-barrel protein [Rhizomicrobium sp.]
MLKTLARAAVLAAVLATPAYAAADWSGFYAGLNAGGGMANGQFSDGCYYCATDNYDNSFALIGAQAGFDWQDGAVVFGPVADFDWTSLSRSGVLGTSDEDFLREKAKLNWFASVRARAGIAVDNALFYVTAGPIWGHLETPGVEYCCGALDPSPYADGVTFPSTGTRTGLAGGVGIDVMAGDNWSVSGEYLYANFGTKKSIAVDSECGYYEEDYDECEIHNNLNTQIVRIAFNWHFMP